jgi:hypothetical protein
LSTPNVNMDKPPSSGFISSLLNTLRLEPNWTKLDYCNQPEHAHQGAGYVVLAATPTAPYLIVWCTKYFLYNCSMPLNNCGLTMNDLLALELSYVLFDHNSKRHPYKPPRGRGGVTGQKVLTKIVVANYKLMLNRCISQTISTGRPSHCVLACRKQDAIYPQHYPTGVSMSRSAPPPGAGLHGTTADDTLINYSVHVFPVFSKATASDAITEEEEVASVYDAAVDVTHRPANYSNDECALAPALTEELVDLATNGCSSSSAPNGIASSPIEVPVPVGDVGDSDNPSRQQSSASVCSSIDGVRKNSVSNKLRALSTALFASSPDTMTLENTAANASATCTTSRSTTNTSSKSSPRCATAADTHPKVAYVVVQFSNLNLPPLPR